MTIPLLYGDFNNWSAAFAFWVFKYYGFKNLKLMDGGRKKWLDEHKQLTTIIPNYQGNFVSTIQADLTVRTTYQYVKENLWNAERSKKILIDVRTNDEYGKILSLSEYPSEKPQSLLYYIRYLPLAMFSQLFFT